MTMVDDSAKINRHEQLGLLIVLVLILMLAAYTLKWGIANEQRDLTDRSVQALQQAGLEHEDIRVEISGRDATLSGRTSDSERLQSAEVAIKEVYGIRKVLIDAKGTAAAKSANSPASAPTEKKRSTLETVRHFAGSQLEPADGINTGRLASDVDASTKTDRFPESPNFDEVAEIGRHETPVLTHSQTDVLPPTEYREDRLTRTQAPTLVSDNGIDDALTPGTHGQEVSQSASKVESDTAGATASALQTVAARTEVGLEPENPSSPTPSAVSDPASVSPPAVAKSTGVSVESAAQPIPKKSVASTATEGAAVRSSDHPSLFVAGSSLLTQDGYSELGAIARELKADPARRPELQVFTTDSGNPYFNALLSQHRMHVIQSTLAQLGIHPSRVIVRTYVGGPGE